MAFKLAKTENFRAPVTIESTDEKGRVLKETVHCVYRRPNEAECKEWATKDNAEVMAEFLVDVEGMTDEEGASVLYVAENRLAFLAYPPATFASASVFWQCARTGKSKN